MSTWIFGMGQTRSRVVMYSSSYADGTFLSNFKRKKDIRPLELVVNFLLEWRGARNRKKQKD